MVRKEPSRKKPAMTPSALAKSGSALPAGQAKPIVVGEVADKSEIRRIARRLMRD